MWLSFIPTMLTSTRHNTFNMNFNWVCIVWLALFISTTCLGKSKSLRSTLSRVRYTWSQFQSTRLTQVTDIPNHFLISEWKTFSIFRIRVLVRGLGLACTIFTQVLVGVIEHPDTVFGPKINSLETTSFIAYLFPAERSGVLQRWGGSEPTASVLVKVRVCVRVNGGQGLSFLSRKPWWKL